MIRLSYPEQERTVFNDRRKEEKNGQGKENFHIDRILDDEIP